MSGWFTLFTNCRYVLDGELVDDHLVISDETGLILKRDGYIGGEAIDLEDSIIAPGFLELHTNGVNGFHFTQFEDEKSYASKIDDVAGHYATQGVTGFWATIPTVEAEEFQKVSCSDFMLLCASSMNSLVLSQFCAKQSSPSNLLFLSHPARAVRHHHLFDMLYTLLG
jgi:alpha-D-ribose 1-methylphosphonate 5-triphosphate diphosphatase PhnM